MTYLKDKLATLTWDLWCIISLVGIWPRFIEPNLIKNKHLNIPIKNLPLPLSNLKILQFSDLHINNHTSKRFLNRLSKKIQRANPHLIVFTGDFLCEGILSNSSLLKTFLKTLKPSHGIYTILGNHDYAEYFSLKTNGDYSLKKSDTPIIKKAFHRLFSKAAPPKPLKNEDAPLPHKDLLTLLKETGCQLLHNETVQIIFNDAQLNLTGLGEYILGQCKPQQAFEKYIKEIPGIVLTHNPDSLPLLKHFPGELILSGHTHFGQVNLPWFKHRLIVLENPTYYKGLNKAGNRWIYTHPGVGALFPFRWFAPPEITHIQLVPA